MRVLLHQQDGRAEVAQLENRSHDLFGRERCQPQRRLIGDEHLGRVGQRRCEAQHLLLATREQPRGLLPSFLAGCGTGRMPSRALLGSEEHR